MNDFSTYLIGGMKVVILEALFKSTLFLSHEKVEAFHECVIHIQQLCLLHLRS